MPYLLRDGTLTPDVRRDRLVEFDARSRNYRAVEGTPETLVPKVWPLPQRIRLDQGREGACVGFAWTHEILAAPWRSLRKLGDEAQRVFATNLYYEAQRTDDWLGGAYPGANPQYEGTSTLAGAKASKTLGYIDAYGWCFTIDDCMRAVSHRGPVVVGTYWKEAMDNDAFGYLTVEGENRGGHEYLLRGLVHMDDGWYFRITNSWGPMWGIGGDAYIRVEDFEKLLHEDGDACIPMQRRRPDAS